MGTIKLEVKPGVYQGGEAGTLMLLEIGMFEDAVAVKVVGPEVDGKDCVLFFINDNSHMSQLVEFIRNTTYLGEL